MNVIELIIPFRTDDRIVGLENAAAALRWAADVSDDDDMEFVRYVTGAAQSLEDAAQALRQ